MSTEMINSYLIISGDREKASLSASKIWQEKNNRQGIDYLNHPDFIILESQTSIGIGKIRELKTQIWKNPFILKFRAVYVPMAEKLTQASQNALLKTLEEPPAHTIIILATAKPLNLLETVISRCLIINSSLKSAFEKNESIIQFWQEISGQNPGQRLLAIEKFSQNQESAKNFLEQSLFFWQEKLNQKISGKKNIATNCRLLSQAIGQLEKNCQTQLVLGNLILNVSNIKLVL